MSQYSNHTATQITSALTTEWVIKSLKDLTDFANGKPHEDDIDVDGRYALITLDSVDIKGRLKKSHRMTNVWDESLRAGDIVSVLSDLAHGLLLGMSAVIPEDKTYVLNQRMGRLRLKVPGNSDFVRFQINARQEHFRKRGQGTSQRHIYKRDFESLEVPFPDPHEQDAIATALFDVDSLIIGLEKLIAKKRDLKQATMQQLLTGKTRLPGFSGEWAEVCLGGLARIQRGASPRPIESPVWFDDTSSVGWVRISDVTSSGMYLSETQQRLSPLGVQHSRPVDRGNLIMSICATVGRPVITKIDVCIHDGFVVFDKPQADKNFLYYVLKWIEPSWSKQGQTGSQMNLNTPLINSTKIMLPPAKEQTAIAEALSAIDTELVALEFRLTKTRELKQGMMQELLTGRTRLV